MTLPIALTLMTALGLSLIFADRVISKPKIVTFDKFLSRIVFINRKKLLLLVGVPVPFLAYQVIRESQSLLDLTIFGFAVLLVSILGVLVWILLGGILAYEVFKDSDTPYRWVIVILLALAAPALTIVFLLLFVVRLTLSILIYPINGLSISKLNFAKSWGGLVGLGLVLAATCYAAKLSIPHITWDNRLILLLDWVGSILMLGTLWAWIYSKISPPLKRRLTRSDRRLKALERWVRIKYGDAMENSDMPDIKDPILRRFRIYRSKRGIKSGMSIIEIAHTLRGTAEIESQYPEETEQYERDKKQLFGLMVKLVLGFCLQWLHRRLIIIIDKITYSVFSGVIGATLFLVGFLLWNLSKVLSFQIQCRC
jgi:hypothetical protein